MGRTDYFDDPTAPSANSLVVAVVVVVINEGQVLMIQRTDNDLWSLPGGGQELGESVSGAAIRETHEETGIQVGVTGLVGIYSDPRRVIAYDDGEVRQEFAICLRARPVAGTLRTSDESQRVAWIHLDAIDSLRTSEYTRRRIRHAFEANEPHID